MWHSQETTHRPAPYRFERYGGLVVCNPEIPNAAVRCRGIPPHSRGGGCQEDSTLIELEGCKPSYHKRSPNLAVPFDSFVCTWGGCRWSCSLLALRIGLDKNLIETTIQLHFERSVLADEWIFLPIIKCYIIQEYLQVELTTH